MTNKQFVNMLHANGPIADRAAQMMLYGQFIGSWDGRLVYWDDEGVQHETSAEVHFGWVLEGRAVQDVWIAPALKARKKPEHVLMYGSTFRVYDPKEAIWQITWIDPVQQAFIRMAGQKIGGEIVQECRREDGTRCRWMFTEITADSFHWINRESIDNGENWKIKSEFFLQRRMMNPADARRSREHLEDTE
jgi:hypothetical protein